MKPHESRSQRRWLEQLNTDRGTTITTDHVEVLRPTGSTEKTVEIKPHLTQGHLASEHVTFTPVSLDIYNDAVMIFDGEITLTAVVDAFNHLFSTQLDHDDVELIYTDADWVLGDVAVTMKAKPDSFYYINQATIYIRPTISPTEVRCRWIPGEAFACWVDPTTPVQVNWDNGVTETLSDCGQLTSPAGASQLTLFSTRPFTVRGVDMNQHLLEIAALYGLGRQKDISGLLRGASTLISVAPFWDNGVWIERADEAFMDCRELTSLPPADLKRLVSARRAFANTRLMTIPTNRYWSLVDATEMCADNKGWSTLPPMWFPQVRSAMGQFSNNLNLTTLQVRYDRVVDIQRLAMGSKKLQVVNIAGLERVVYADHAYDGCSALQQIPTAVYPSAVSVDYIHRRNDQLSTVSRFEGSLITSAIRSFARCGALSTVERLNLPALTDADGIFEDDGELVGVENFIAPELRKAPRAFANCTKLQYVRGLAGFMLENGNEMFLNTSALETQPSLLFDHLITANGMMEGASKLFKFHYPAFPKLQFANRMFKGMLELHQIGETEFPSLVEARSMYEDTPNLATLPTMHYPEVVEAEYMLRRCGERYIHHHPLLHFPKARSVKGLLAECTWVKMVGEFLAPLAEDVSEAFLNNRNLTFISRIDIGRAKNTSRMLEGCDVLTHLPKISMENVEDATDMLKGCYEIHTLGGFGGLRTSLDLSDTQCDFDSAWRIAKLADYVTDGQVLNFTGTPAADHVSYYRLETLLKSRGWTLIPEAKKPYLPLEHEPVSGSHGVLYIGEVPAADFITGEQLAAIVGLTEGVSHASNTNWIHLKFDGRHVLIPKRPLRHGVSWDTLANLGLVYGGSNDPIFTVGPHHYRVRLLKGANSNPTELTDSLDTWPTHSSEWNRVMYRLHRDIPSSQEGDNLAEWSNLDLNLSVGSNGHLTWCQEASFLDVNQRVVRGGSVDRGLTASKGMNGPHYGWRPVLVLID